jgi:hypothetical protein
VSKARHLDVPWSVNAARTGADWTDVLAIGVKRLTLSVENRIAVSAGHRVAREPFIVIVCHGHYIRIGMTTAVHFVSKPSKVTFIAAITSSGIMNAPPGHPEAF